MDKNLDSFYIVLFFLLLQIFNFSFSIFVVYTARNLSVCGDVCMSSQMAAAFQLVFLGVMIFFVWVKSIIIKKERKENIEEEGLIIN